MKQTTEKVYRCDFCNKAMVRVGLMKLHERMCKKNPNNQHKCFLYCKYLERDQEPIRDDEGNKAGWNEASFTCAKMPDVELFSYKLERYECNRLRCEQRTRMPLECDLYETMDGHYYRDDPAIPIEDDWFDI
jgi:hypothetical protein